MSTRNRPLPHRLFSLAHFHRTTNLHPILTIPMCPANHCHCTFFVRRTSSLLPQYYTFVYVSCFNIYLRLELGLG